MERKEENFDDLKAGYFREHAATKDGRFRVACVSNGYHGDVWPMVTLAQALKKNHYAVRLFIPENFLHLCTESGVDAVAVFDDTRQALEQAGGHDNVFSTSLGVALALGEWFKKGTKTCRGVQEALDIFEPQLVVFGNVWPRVACNYEEATGIPAIPIFFNRSQLKRTQDKWSEEVPRPLIYAVSDMLDTHELSSRVVRVGPLGQMLQGEIGNLSVELQDFLSQGSAPVAAGFGSMILRWPRPAQLLCMILGALKASGKRGVVIGGWQRLDRLGQELLLKGTLPGLSFNASDLVDFARKQVFFAEHVPYESLLPECCCLIHHGGAGTTHTAMRVGCPQIVAPASDDQLDYAELVADAGVGIGLKSLYSLSVRDLQEAIGNAALLKDSALYVSSVMASESGEEEVCKLIEQVVKEQLPQAGSIPRPTIPPKKEEHFEEVALENFDDDFGSWWEQFEKATEIVVPVCSDQIEHELFAKAGFGIDEQNNNWSRQTSASSNPPAEAWALN